VARVVQVRRLAVAGGWPWVMQIRICTGGVRWSWEISGPDPGLGELSSWDPAS